MTTEQMRKRINTDPDFVALKRFDFSLEKVIEKHPNGVPNKLIAAALLMTEEEVEDLYEKVVAKLRVHLGVSDPGVT